MTSTLGPLDEVDEDGDKGDSVVEADSQLDWLGLPFSVWWDCVFDVIWYESNAWLGWLDVLGGEIDDCGGNSTAVKKRTCPVCPWDIPTKKCEIWTNDYQFSCLTYLKHWDYDLERWLMRWCEVMEVSWWFQHLFQSTEDLCNPAMKWLGGKQLYAAW